MIADRLRDTGPHLLRDGSPGIECGRSTTWERPAFSFVTFTTLDERCLLCVEAFNKRQAGRTRHADARAGNVVE